MIEPALAGLAVRTALLRRIFGATTAVDRVTFDVRRGEIFAIVGPDGAGKTTLMRLLCGVLEPTDGEADVAGHDVVAHPDEVKARIGYMPQRFSLYADLTLMENLRFYAELFDVPASMFRQRAASLLADFELAPFEARLAGTLSGGMKQKLALACTLIHEPELLLLDEPTAGVDPVSRRRFWRLLYRLNAGGKTIVVNTPYMDEAEHAVRVALMHRGAFVACDTPHELKAHIAGDVIEITTADMPGARRALRDLPFIRSLELFGPRLHALVPSADIALPGINARLEEQAVGDARVTRIAPSLEDAFVALIGASEPAGETRS